MTAKYANGKYAYGFCEKCGFRYSLADLKAETFKGNIKSNRVCPPCWDEDHPQNFLATVDAKDPQSLRRPVPDTGLDQANASLPVIQRVFGMYTQSDIGSVVVATS